MRQIPKIFILISKKIFFHIDFEIKSQKEEMKMKAENYTERDSQFYPTPKSLLDKNCKGFGWKKKIKTVLEPSAEKGDITDYVKEKIKRILYQVLLQKETNIFKICCRKIQNFAILAI